MLSAPMHKEDVKAELRKRHGSVAQFERAKALPEESVADVLRGRSVKRTAQAIADELGVEIQGCAPSESVKPDDSAAKAGLHYPKAATR